MLGPVNGTTIEDENPPARRRFHSAGAGDRARTDIAERMEELLAALAEGPGHPRRERVTRGTRPGG